MVSHVLQQTGYTPLMFAARGGHIQIVQKLVSHSVNLVITDKVGTLEVRTSISVKYNSKATAPIRNYYQISNVSELSTSLKQL